MYKRIPGFLEMTDFPAGNFLVPNFLFPVFCQEMCHSSI